MAEYEIEECGYIKALRAAGAVVHDWRAFGTWQGDIWAHVTFDGRTGFVSIGYGSCSGCDPWEMEFCCDDPTDEQIAEFGRQYLDEILDGDAALAEAEFYTAWDVEADTAAACIRARMAASVTP